MSTKEEELEQLRAQLKKIIKNLETPLIGYLNSKRSRLRTSRQEDIDKRDDLRDDIKTFLKAKNNPNIRERYNKQSDVLEKYEEELTKEYKNNDVLKLIQTFNNLKTRIRNLLLEIEDKAGDTTSGTESMSDTDSDSDEEMQGTADKGTGTADDPYVVELLKF